MKNHDNTQADSPSAELSTLLSQVLIAFTTELDNEFERRTPHRTTDLRASASRGSASRTPTSLMAASLTPVSGASANVRGAPWLVSFAMWSNFLQFVDAEGVSVDEFGRRARLSKEGLQIWLERMAKWWGYVVVEPDPADARPNPPRSAWRVRPTAGGLRAQEVWRTLPGEIEGRWVTRFGTDAIGSLRDSLETVARKLDVELPARLPILGYGFFSPFYEPNTTESSKSDERNVSELHLHALLAKVLLAFTLEFERESDVSLAIAANAMRVLTAEGIRTRDLPSRTGVSKEASVASLGWLERGGYVTIEPGPTAPRAKFIRLTAKGRQAQDACTRRLDALERQWEERFGADAIRRLREALLGVVAGHDGTPSRFAEGLRPHPGGWRARKPYVAQTEAVMRDPRAALPHYPMVWHRGGWPDGN